jgi:hypothetical protein
MKNFYERSYRYIIGPIIIGLGATRMKMAAVSTINVFLYCIGFAFKVSLLFLLLFENV